MKVFDWVSTNSYCSPPSNTVEFENMSSSVKNNNSQCNTELVNKNNIRQKIMNQYCHTSTFSWFSNF